MFSFYGSDIESVLTFSIIEWFGSSTAQVSHITQIFWLWSSSYWWDLCLTFAEKKVLQSWKLPYIQPDTSLRLGAIKTKSTCFLNSTYCRVVHALNCSGIYASAFHSMHSNVSICHIDMTYMYRCIYVKVCKFCHMYSTYRELKLCYSQTLGAYRQH